MANRQFEYMLDQLLSSEAGRVRNQEYLSSAQREISDLKAKVSDLEGRLNQPRPANPSRLNAQSLADLMFADRVKIPAIKVTRAITGLGLKEAKDMVENALAEVALHRDAGTVPVRDPIY